MKKYSQKVSVIIPVYNEQGRLENVLEKLLNFYEVIVVDDSSDVSVASYVDAEKFKNLKILTNVENLGYIKSIKKGIQESSGEIIVTMDGDGEHRVEDIAKLVQPIEKNRCDIVFGTRPNIVRESERLLLWIAKVFTGSTIKDAGTGFRAIRSSYAKKLHFFGSCTCGTLLQECIGLKMRVCEVKVILPVVDKPRKIAWDHFWQFFSLIKLTIKQKLQGEI